MVEPLSLSIAIGFLVKNAPSWFHSLETTLLGKGRDLAVEQGKVRVSAFFDEKKHLHHMELALKNAAERGLKRFKTLEERDQYRSMLTLLSDFNSDTLRQEAMQLFTLSDNPDLAILSEKYNLSQRIHALAQHKIHEEVDAAPYLRSFFEALIAEIYNDPLFREQMSDVLRVRAASQGQRSLEEILSLLNNINLSLTQDYTNQQFLQEVAAYIEYVESIYRYHEFAGIVLKGDEDTAPELDTIFIPLRTKFPSLAYNAIVSKDSISALLEEYLYIVLLGGPGSGKSTTTRHLAWHHAAANMSSTSAIFSQTPGLLPGKPVPLRIELRRFIDARRLHPGSSFLSYATDVMLAQENLSIHPQMFNELLDRRVMLLLFDGLDEVPTLAERRQLIKEIEYFASRYPGNRILVTSRPVGYDASSFSNRWFKRCEVQEFDDEQIYAFLENWYKHVLKHPTISSDLRRELEAFFTTLKENTRLHKLATNPLLLTVMTAIHRYERLPDKRVQVYERCADLLLDKWAKLKGVDNLRKEMKLSSKEDQNACIAQLGFVLHERSQGESVKNTNVFLEDEYEDEEEQPAKDAATDVSEDFILHEIRRYIRDQQLLPSVAEQKAEAEHFLELVKVEAGLIVERGTDENGEPLYGFIHRTFQEYFAALHIYERYQQEESAEVISNFIQQHLHHPHWREVILLLLGMLKRRPVTAQLAQILEGNSLLSIHSGILQQDLFFVCDCLAEDISVESHFVEHVATSLYELILSSPFPTQRREALTALSKLMQTQQCATICRQKFDKLVREIAVLNILDQLLLVIKNIYLMSTAGSEEDQYATQLFLTLVQRTDFSAEQMLKVTEIAYRCSSLDSEEQHQIGMLLLTFLRRPGILLEQMLQAAEIVYLNCASGAEEERQVAKFLLAYMGRSDLPPEQMLQVAGTLYRYSSIHSEEKRRATELLFTFIQRTDLPVEQVLQAFEIICSSTSPGMEISLPSAQPLLDIGRRSDISPEQVVQVCDTISRWYGDVPSQANELLLSLLQRAELSPEKIVFIAQAFSQLGSLLWGEEKSDLHLLDLAQHSELSTGQTLEIIDKLQSYPYPWKTDSEVIQRAVAFLLDLAQRPDLSSEQMLRVAETLYRLTSHGSEERQRAFQLFLDLAQRPDLSSEQILRVAEVLYKKSWPGSSKVEGLGFKLLLGLSRSPDLSSEQMLRISNILINDSYLELRQRQVQLLGLAQRPDLSSEQMLWVAETLYRLTSHGSEERQRAFQLFLDLAQRPDLSSEQVNTLVKLIYDADQLSNVLANQEKVATKIRDRLYQILRASVLGIESANIGTR